MILQLSLPQRATHASLMIQLSEHTVEMGTTRPGGGGGGGSNYLLG